MANEKRVTVDMLKYFKELQDASNAATFVGKVEGKGLSANDFTNALATKLDGVAEGAQVNVVETVQVNGTTVNPNNKVVNIDLTDYALKADVATVYTAKGSVNNYSDLPNPSDEDESLRPKIGYVYNIINADAEHNINAGDNVVYTANGWDNLSGIVDLTAYAKTADVNSTLLGYVQTVQGKGLSTEDFTTALKTKLEGITVAEQADIYEIFHPVVPTTYDFAETPADLITVLDNSEDIEEDFTGVTASYDNSVITLTGTFTKLGTTFTASGTDFVGTYDGKVVTVSNTGTVTVAE